MKELDEAVATNDYVQVAKLAEKYAAEVKKERGLKLDALLRAEQAEAELKKARERNVVLQQLLDDSDVEVNRLREAVRAATRQAENPRTFGSVRTKEL